MARTLQHRFGRAAHGIVGLALGLMCAGIAIGQQTHEHVPLQVDATLDWDTLIDTTLAAHPQSGELKARADEASAWMARGRHWLAAAPSLYFSYLSDSALDDRGQREYEGGIDLPLWRPRQRGAVQDVAGSAGAESAAAAAALRLEVAGRLRGALWDVAAAANANATISESVAVAAELVRVVERRNARGDLPLADVLLARSALFERQQASIAAQAQLVDAERAYQSLTGLTRRPAEFGETRSARGDFEESHPLLALADAELERARANLELVDQETRGNPTLAIGPRRQRDALTSYFNDSLAVAIKIPVGGKSHGGTQTAHGARLVAEAETARGALLRRLDLDLHEAEHALLVVEQSLALAEQRRDLGNQQWQMAQSAFAQGEIELRDLLRIQETAQNVSRDAERLAVERQRTIAAFNQAIGETP